MTDYVFALRMRWSLTLAAWAMKLSPPSRHLPPAFVSLFEAYEAEGKEWDAVRKWRRRQRERAGWER